MAGIQVDSRREGQAAVAFAAMLLVISSGCHTVSSLGLPVSSGSNYLLSDAKEVREAVGHQGGVATELAKVPLPPHRVEAGDVLVIEPNDFNSPVQIPSDHTVQQDGTIDLGSYGRMQVAGLTVTEIQQQVQFAVTQKESIRRQSEVGLVSHNVQPLPTTEEDVDLGIAVKLISQERGLVYVMGEVNAPGSYPIVGSETVLDALISAGGLSDRANDHKIILTRPRTSGTPRCILPVCYQQILQLGDTSTNYQLQPGDRIYVPSLTVWEDIKQSAQWRRERSCPQCRDYSGD